MRLFSFTLENVIMTASNRQCQVWWDTVAQTQYMKYGEIGVKTEFDIKLTEKDLYSFNIYQTYHGVHGIFSILIAALVFVMAVVSGKNGELGYAALYVVVGILLLIYVPASLKLRVKQTMKTNKVLSGVLHYEISEEGIKVTSGDESGELPWNLVYQVLTRKNSVLIYSNRVNAYIIPKDQLGDKYDTLIEIAKKSLESYRLKIK